MEQEGIWLCFGTTPRTSFDVRVEHFKIWKSGIQQMPFPPLLTKQSSKIQKHSGRFETWHPSIKYSSKDTDSFHSLVHSGLYCCPPIWVVLQILLHSGLRGYQRFSTRSLLRQLESYSQKCCLVCNSVTLGGGNKVLELGLKYHENFSKTWGGGGGE